ncbi:MAG: cryptochrome/photolyase family protein [Myxococcota bacterium]
MKHFRRELDAREVDPAGRRWLFVAYDQLTDAVGPLSREDPDELGIILVESRWKARRRPYHRQKLALVLANLRHFALEQAERGVAVRHVAGDAPYSRLLEPVTRELGPLRAMRPAERELRCDLAPLVKKKRIEIVPHEGWLTSREQFRAAFEGGKPWRMDRFYRHVRRETGILMSGGKPAGGKFSFDTENRKPWRGDPAAPKPPRYSTDDPIKQEVVELVGSAFGDHPGEIEPRALPATAKDAERAWRWARRHCLEHFGPYEDAMSTRSSTLFHTQTSALLNLQRLLPARVVEDVAAMDLPLASQEGFIRQVLGWREFVRHVHEETDGFRHLPDGTRPPRAAARVGGGACPSALDAEEPLPPAFWGEPSGLTCLDTVVEDVWKTGYGHHITRLMVLSNLATLLGVSPREVTDWFWAAYTDAYDWVVEPNVLGMGTFGLGDLFTTKPYVSGAAYIDRMSDYCGECAFSPKRDCPITSLYWSFLCRNEAALRDNPRVAMPLRSLARRSRGKREHDRRVHDWVQGTLRAGERLCPSDSPTPNTKETS